MIEEVVDLGQLLAREQHWIDALACRSDQNGYNLCPVAGNRSGAVMPESFREKISALHKGKPKSDEHRARISAARKGQRKTEEHKAKLAAATREHMADRERRGRQAAYGAMATPHMRGKKHSPEMIEKLRASHAKRPRDAKGHYLPRESPAD